MGAKFRASHFGNMLAMLPNEFKMNSCLLHLGKQYFAITQKLHLYPITRKGSHDYVTPPIRFVS
jgi:hypothetical protein